MPIQIGKRPENFFNNPLGLLSDCHRRIERFLYLLITIARQARGGALSDEQVGAMECALRYFSEAAPNHVRDEEDSLFPRLRERQGQQIQRAMKQLASLEDEHVVVERTHLEVEQLGKQWMEKGELSPDEAMAFSDLLAKLSRIYHQHIRIEEKEIFPLAANLLEQSVVHEIGREMAERRHIDVEMQTAYHA